MDIVVIGSFMMDLVVQTPRAPQEGETIIGSSFNRFPGGKGANQVVAASRLGGNTMFIGNVGADQFGHEALDTLRKENVNIDRVLMDQYHATGVGSITLEDNGENRIIVVPGANFTFTLKDLEEVKEYIKQAKVVVLQLEMNTIVVEKAIDYAYEYGVPVILNPAPAAKLSNGLLSKVTYLTPNKSEAELLTGIKINNEDEAVRAANILLNKGVNNVIITLGKSGALIVNNEQTTHVPGYTAKQIDTVAAGDAFNGALAVGLTQNKSLEDIIDYANAVGALTITKSGAIPSLPRSEEVNDFINNVIRL